MRGTKPEIRWKAEAAFFLSAVFFVAVAAVIVFRRLPIEGTSLGLDWKTIWDGIGRGDVVYGPQSDQIGGMYTPPWGILILFPLSLLPFRDSWALISLFTILTLIFLVPRRDNGRLDGVGILLLACSFPALRTLADGNLEAFVLAGSALLLRGMERRSPLLAAAGFMLATVKFQVIWLAIIFLPWKLWQRFNWGEIVTFVGSAVFMVAISMLLWGRDWLLSLFGGAIPWEQGMVELAAGMGRGGVIDITLRSTLQRIDFPPVLITCVWLILVGAVIYVSVRKQRLMMMSLFPGFAFLLTSSILLAPYVSGDSFLCIYALAILPLIRENRTIGVILLLAVNLLFFVPRSLLFSYQSTYLTFLSLIVWFFLVVQIMRKEAEPLEAPAATDRERGV